MKQPDLTDPEISKFEAWAKGLNPPPRLDRMWMYDAFDTGRKAFEVYKFDDASWALAGWMARRISA